MTEMKLLPGRATVHFNPEETPEILRRYTTVGRLLQAATEMEFLMHCWIEALLKGKGANPPSSAQTKSKDFPALRKKLLGHFDGSSISTEIRTRVIEALMETEYLMKVRNIVCHNPLVTGDTGVPQTRGNWKAGNITLSQASIEEVACSFRKVCNALYEGYRDSFDHKAPCTTNPNKWTKLDNDFS